MGIYYNDNDPFCCQWLRNLIAAGLLPQGDVDARDIQEVRAGDLRGYRQCHFFAGIGGWPLALRIADQADLESVWTGSPPRQDVSLAGAVWGVRRGLRGHRTSLVGTWCDLVDALRPRTLYFENVPGIKKWLAEITGRLESLGYGVTPAERTTAAVAGPHLRRRVWLAADRDGARCEESWLAVPQPAAYRDPRRTPPGDVWTPAPNRAVGMADGFPSRVAAIRAFGNAIDPWVAADFIRAYQDAVAKRRP